MHNESLFEDVRINRAMLALLVIGTLFLAAKFMVEVKSYAYVGTGVTAGNTVYVTGEGEVFAIPDIATIAFSAREEGKTVADAQKKVSTKIDAALAFLEGAGIDEKDIKTVSYNAYPRYEYGEIGCLGSGCPKPGTRVLAGYEVSQSISVKVRDTEKAGAILEGVAKAGIADISGPDFAIDDDTALQAEARKKAIADAREKAVALARDLGVELVRVVNFSESGNYPIYYKAEMAVDGRGGASVPQVPVGENRIVSTVTITYEIR